MPKIVPEMTALEVKRLTHPGHGGNARFPVGGVAGLMLQITEGGGRSWVFRVMVGPKRRTIGLGAFPAVGLAQARQRAAEMLDQIRQGVDPLEQRRAAKAALATAQARGVTFDQATERFLASKLNEFSNPKHRQQWTNTLATYASPMIGPIPVAEITVQDILRVLEPIWTTKPETASRLRGRVEAVLSWAEASGYREAPNPAVWKNGLERILPKPSKLAKVRHQPALSLIDVAEWFAELKQRKGAAARALELATLCASRSGEVRLATWQELDLDAGLWIIPPQRMKMGREHRVPLVPDAVALIRDLPRMAGSDFVFTAQRGGALTDMALSMLLRKMHAKKLKADGVGWVDPTSGRRAVPHGLRSSFRQWTAEKGYARDMSELALAHRVGTEVERSYQRSDMLDRRRAMMADWGRFLRGESGAKVVPIRGAGQ